jgi:hypothetical protein
MRLSLRKILTLLLVLVIVSRTGKILQFLEGLQFDGILTLEPLRRSPEEGRFLVTVLLCALVFVTVFFLINRRK